jgi:hypothetical protein
MVNYSKAFSDTVWYNIVETDATYMLQVKKGNVFVIASTAIPTSSSGAFELEAGSVLHSNLLLGNIWVRSVDGTGLIAYAK